MLSRKIACPSCDAKLKIAETLPEDTMISCPKCGIGFPAPSANGHATEEPPRTAPPRKYDADDEDSAPERRPSRKKFRKKKQAASKTPLIIGLALGVLLLIGAGGGVAAVFLWPKKASAVADNNAAKSAPSQGQGPTQMQQGASGGSPAPGAGAPAGISPSGPGAGAMTPDQSGAAGAPPSNPGPDVGGGAAAGTGQSDEFAAGKQVFARSCTNCHTIGNEGASSGGRGGQRKRDIAGVGAEHNADWFVKFVGNPRATKPGSKMQGFAGRLSDADIRAVAQYLASLK